jgi:hypothetical protein
MVSVSHPGAVHFVTIGMMPLYPLLGRPNLLGAGTTSQIQARIIGRPAKRVKPER